jgi:hypothetical protein
MSAKKETIIKSKPIEVGTGDQKVKPTYTIIININPYVNMTKQTTIQ